MQILYYALSLFLIVLGGFSDPLISGVGVFVGVVALSLQITNHESEYKRKSSEMFEVERRHWYIEFEDGLIKSAKIYFPSSEHGKGKHISVEIAQNTLKPLGFKIPEIDRDGNITIRLKENNTLSPRAPAPVSLTISGR